MEYPQISYRSRRVVKLKVVAIGKVKDHQRIFHRQRKGSDPSLAVQKEFVVHRASMFFRRALA